MPRTLSVQRKKLVQVFNKLAKAQDAITAALKAIDKELYPIEEK